MSQGRIAVMVLLAALAAGAARAEEKPSPEFERLKALAGEWEGLARVAGEEKALPSAATVKLVSAGSAVMLVTDPGTPHEMVTMFHRDDASLLATHYCAAMNQPRLKLQPGKDPGRLAFEFMDGTNLLSYPGRMQRLVLTLPDADRQVQEWTHLQDGNSATMVFELRRKK